MTTVASYCWSTLIYAVLISRSARQLWHAYPLRLVVMCTLSVVSFFYGFSQRAVIDFSFNFRIF
jgi:hypothetical protein